MASAWEFQPLLEAPSLCLSRRGTVAATSLLPPTLDWLAGCSRDLSDGADRRTSSKAGGGVDEEDEDEGRLRDSPSSLLVRGRNETEIHKFSKCKVS